MDRRTYEIEAKVERDHWWFKGRRKILGRLLSELPAIPGDARVLDVGCGTGANAAVLANGGQYSVGIDASPIPLGLSRGGHSAFVRGDAERLPFGDGSFARVVALDVLEHLDDDARGAAELFRVLQTGGAAIIFVPALEILWGLQDDVSHHRRRYGKSQLVSVVERAGFDVERVTFFNTLLFAPILAARLAMRLYRPPDLASENHVSGPIANRVLSAVFSLEAPLVGHLSLPIGVSLACVAIKA